MAIYEILTKSGNVLKTIIADYAFVEANYPGRFEEVIVETPAIETPEPEPDRLEAIEIKLDKVVKDIAAILESTRT